MKIMNMINRSNFSSNFEEATKVDLSLNGLSNEQIIKEYGIFPESRGFVFKEDGNNAVRESNFASLRRQFLISHEHLPDYLRFPHRRFSRDEGHHEKVSTQSFFEIAEKLEVKQHFLDEQILHLHSEVEPKCSKTNCTDNKEFEPLLESEVGLFPPVYNYCAPTNRWEKGHVVKISQSDTLRKPVASRPLCLHTFHINADDYYNNCHASLSEYIPYLEFSEIVDFVNLLLPIIDELGLIPQLYVDRGSKNRLKFLNTNEYQKLVLGHETIFKKVLRNGKLTFEKRVIIRYAVKRKLNVSPFRVIANTIPIKVTSTSELKLIIRPIENIRFHEFCLF